MNGNQFVVRRKNGNIASVFIIVMFMMTILAACGDSGQPAEKGSSASTPARITKLIYKNDMQSFDYLKETLAKGDQSIDQRAYALHEAGSISLGESGEFSFSSSGPGYRTQFFGDTADELEEGPMRIEITGKIDMKALNEMIAKGSGSAVIGQGRYTHTVSVTKKSTFARGDYESISYTETAECALQIIYSSDSKEISLSPRDIAFNLKRSGKEISSYSGDISESAYEREEPGSAIFFFVPE